MTSHSVRLSLSYDGQRLERDLHAASRKYKPVSQYGKDHNGEWTGLSLHSEGGDPYTTRTGIVPSSKPFTYTPVVNETPYIRELLDGMLCPKRSVRLSYLPAGGRIESHVDSPLTFQHGILRLHVPIVTHPDVEFIIGGERCRWQAGELWWGNFSQPHHVYNESPVNRVHLLLDVEINDYVLGLFPSEFIESQRTHGILEHRRPVRLTASELRRFACEVAVPRGALPHLLLRDGALARFEPGGDRLNLTSGGQPIMQLVPVAADEFAIIGWSSGVTVRFTLSKVGPSNERVVRVAFVIRGLPKRMFEAESPDNPRLAINEIELRVLASRSNSPHLQQARRSPE